MGDMHAAMWVAYLGCYKHVADAQKRIRQTDRPHHIEIRILTLQISLAITARDGIFHLFLQSQ